MDMDIHGLSEESSQGMTCMQIVVSIYCILHTTLSAVRLEWSKRPVGTDGSSVRDGVL